jgi:sphingomyelin phosphodiesterase acid-like 3
MRSAVAEPQAVLISGDFLPHHFREQWNAAASDRSDAAFYAFAEKTVAYLAAAFDAAFPRAQFVITLGNNDSPCGDNVFWPHSPFLTHFAQAWEPLVNRAGRAPGFARDFPADGDYAVAMPNGTRILAVNSNPWSALAETGCDPGGSAANDTMTWFEKTVAAAPSGARTWTILHVPPGIDAYASQRRGTPVPFYPADLLARFRAVRAADGAPLGLIVAGHLHVDGFRIVDRTPLLFVPSISPNHANNPAFFVATIDGRNGAIADYAAHFLTLAPPAAPPGGWAQEYDFNQAYHLGGVGLSTLRTLEESIRADAATRSKEAGYYVAQAPVRAISDTTWRAYWCANTALEPAAYATCLAGP